MERTFNAVIRSVANRNNLELLGHIHGAADDLNVLARKKGLLVRHSFDFHSKGNISFWIDVLNEELEELYHGIKPFEETEEILDILNKAYDLVAEYGNEKKEEEF